jgi:SAM-dependent methyltransferase
MREWYLMIRWIVGPLPIGVRSQWRMFRKRLQFWREYLRYRKVATSSDVSIKYWWPCLEDKTSQTPIDASYYYQDAWAFEAISKIRPRQHLDVGSHHKFVSLLSKIVPTTMVDLRPLPVSLGSLPFVQGSVLGLPYSDQSVVSVSSLCVVEHIGLGRYGDPLDPNGSEKAFIELMRVVAPGGDLYVSVPLDDVNRTYFNAHRAFTEDYLLRLFFPFELVQKRYIYGSEFGDQLKTGFGTGCYHLRRPQNV